MLMCSALRSKLKEKHMLLLIYYKEQTMACISWGYQNNEALLTTATSPFLGHNKDLSLSQSRQRDKHSRLIQSPGNENSSVPSGPSFPLWTTLLLAGLGPGPLLRNWKPGPGGGLGPGPDIAPIPGIETCHKHTWNVFDRNARRFLGRKASTRPI